jgi:glycerate 2-kinase
MGIILKEAAKTKGSEDPPICIIAGGETTVTVRGDGKGGRNQELALGAAIELNGCGNCILVALATDGEDSTMDAAGAIVTGNTIQNGINNRLDAEAFLKNNDSYHYFLQTGGLLRTGPTRTNVNDLILMFVL